MHYVFGFALIVALVFLKRKYDPHNDAFRTKERQGWRLKKAPVIDLSDWKKNKDVDRYKNSKKFR